MRINNNSYYSQGVTSVKQFRGCNITVCINGVPDNNPCLASSINIKFSINADGSISMSPAKDHMVVREEDGDYKTYNIGSTDIFASLLN